MSQIEAAATRLAAVAADPPAFTVQLAIEADVWWSAHRTAGLTRAAVLDRWLSAVRCALGAHDVMWPLAGRDAALVRLAGPEDAWPILQAHEDAAQRWRDACVALGLDPVTALMGAVEASADHLRARQRSCVHCGRSYLPTTGRQRWCPDCQGERVRRKLAASRARQRERSQLEGDR